MTKLSDCHLCKERAILGPVAGCGDLNSRILLLGRNPGVQEVEKGMPFVGPAGHKLDEVLDKAGIRREKCYVTNLVKCGTINPDPPSKACFGLCPKTWLVHELKEMMEKNLRLIISFGNEALEYLEPGATVGRMAGTHWTVHLQQGEIEKDVEVFAMYHPAAALHSQVFDRRLKEDTLRLRRYLDDFRDEWEELMKWPQHTKR